MMDFHSAYHFLITQIQTNQFFSGAALGGLILGAFHYVVRTIPAYISSFFHAQCMVKVNVSSTDPIYDAIQVWIAKSNRFKKSIRLSLFTEYNKLDYDDSDLSDSPTKNTTELHYALAPGNHIFWFKRRLIWLYKERSSVNNITNMSKFVPEFMTFRTIGRNRRIMEQFFEEVLSFSIKEKENRISLYFPGSYGDHWKRNDAKQKRSFDTIFLPKETKDLLVQHVNQFRNNPDWYYKKGIPYRTGLLFYGPPGNGKSSTISALASMFDMNLCVLNLSSENMDDNKLLNLVNSAPTKSFLVLEDIDSAFSNREKAEDDDKKDNKNGLTFSGLLNALDGVAAQEGNIVIMTTNYKDNLDEALIRPGRIDRIIYFGMANKRQMESIFLSFFPGREELAKKFADQLDEDKYSIATLQNYLLRHRDSPKLAVENTEELQ